MMSATTPSPLTPKRVRDERRSAILDIAHAAFLSDGYSATSMSTIAAKLGGSKATLYNYFSSKEELFFAVFQERCEQIQAHLYDVKPEGDDFRSELTELGRRLLRIALSEEFIATFRLVIAESARFPEVGRFFYEVGPRQGQKRLGEYFKRAVEAGYLGRHDPAVMAQHFFDLCMSGIHYRSLWNVVPNPPMEEVHANVDHAVSVFMAAYGRDASAG